MLTELYKNEANHFTQYTADVADIKNYDDVTVGNFIEDYHLAKIAAKFNIDIKQLMEFIEGLE